MNGQDLNDLIEKVDHVLSLYKPTQRRDIKKKLKKILSSDSYDRVCDAIEMALSKRVHRYTSPSQRSVYRIEGNRGNYIVYQYAPYCTCTNFKFAVSHRNDKSQSSFCKHIIAARIAERKRLEESRDVSEQEVQQIILEGIES